MTPQLGMFLRSRLTGRVWQVQSIAAGNVSVTLHDPPPWAPQPCTIYGTWDGFLHAFEVVPA